MLIMNSWKRYWTEEDGVGIVEIILILVILVAIIVIFKDQITGIISDAFLEIENGSSDVNGGLNLNEE